MDVSNLGKLVLYAYTPNDPFLIAGHNYYVGNYISRLSVFGGGIEGYGNQIRGGECWHVLSLPNL